MKIVYVHHAERDIDKSVLGEEQGITGNGLKELELLVEKIPLLNPTAFYTSSYKRCLITTEILNREVNVPIIEEERFNEYDGGSETYKEFLERNIEAIKDIENKYSSDDVIICVTSGVNLSAFVCYFSGNTPSSDSIKCQALRTSPVLFTTDQKLL